MISVVVCCRVEGNPNPRSNPLDLIETAHDNIAKIDSVEFLFKFDDDDAGAETMIRRLRSAAKLPIRFIVTPRRRGYADLHIGYQEALSLASPDCNIVGAMADDFIICMHCWDHFLRMCIERFPDGLFIAHNRPHPPFRPDYFQRPLNLDWKFTDFRRMDLIDESPCWGKKLIDLCGGFGPSFSIDCWTLALEHTLWHRHRIQRTLLMASNFVYRFYHAPLDGLGSTRSPMRDENSNFIESPEYRAILDSQADRISTAIRASGS